MKNFTLSVILAAMLIGSGAMQAKDVSESEALQVESAVAFVLTGKIAN